MSGMGCPQLGFPRLRVAAGKATGIAIGPDHTPPWVTVRQNPRTSGAWFAGAGGRVIFSGRMAVSVEMQHTGDAERQRDVVVMVEHVLSDRPGDWRVSIIGSHGSDRWEMRITGPNAFERSYTLEGTAGEHEPRAIAVIVARMVPTRRLGG
jgi:hypothetical protein